jgi:ABC-type siderophore export system fused ATPase/permease subunit
LLTSKPSVHAIVTVRDPHVPHAVEEAIHHALVAEMTTTATIAEVLATMMPTIVVVHHLAMLIPMEVAVAAVDMTIVIVATAVLQAEVHHLDAMMHTDHHVAGTRNHMVHREGMIAQKT